MKKSDVDAELERKWQKREKSIKEIKNKSLK